MRPLKEDVVGRSLTWEDGKSITVDTTCGNVSCALSNTYHVPALLGTKPSSEELTVVQPFSKMLGPGGFLIWKCFQFWEYLYIYMSYFGNGTQVWTQNSSISYILHTHSLKVILDLNTLKSLLYRVLYVCIICIMSKSFRYQRISDFGILGWECPGCI